jgi:hypothetical protein
MLSEAVGYSPKRGKFYALLDVQRDKRVKTYASSREEAEIVYLSHTFPKEVLITAAEHALPSQELERRNRRYRRYVKRKQQEASLCA